MQGEFADLSGAKFVETPSGGIAVEVRPPSALPMAATHPSQVLLRGEKKTFTAEQVNAMLMTDLKGTCEKSTGVPMADVVYAVPSFFTTRQRRAVIDAGKIAGSCPLLHAPLRLLFAPGMNIIGLINDLSAAALSWGFYRTDLANSSKKVLFIGMGSSYFGASVVEFTAAQATVLSSVNDTTVGGDEIDVAIARRFAKNFGDKYKVRSLSLPFSPSLANSSSSMSRATSAPGSASSPPLSASRRT